MVENSTLSVIAPSKLTGVILEQHEPRRPRFEPLLTWRYGRRWVLAGSVILTCPQVLYQCLPPEPLSDTTTHWYGHQVIRMA